MWALPLRGETVESVLRGFWAGTLDTAAFGHAAHMIVVADLWLSLKEEEAVFTRMREGIGAYFAARNIAPAPDRGYHETLTRAWVRLVGAWLHEHRFMARTTNDVARPLLLESGFSSKTTVQKHYSTARLDSPEARAGWLPPDLAPLPEISPS